MGVILGDFEKKSEKLRDSRISRCPHRVRVWGARWDGRASRYRPPVLDFDAFGAAGALPFECSQCGRRAGAVVCHGKTKAAAFTPALLAVRPLLPRPPAVLWQSAPNKYRYDMV